MLITKLAADAEYQKALDAYNAHDLPAFVAPYSNSVQIFRMPATQPAITGKAQLERNLARAAQMAINV
jgi:hypothetical protein